MLDTVDKTPSASAVQETNAADLPSFYYKYFSVSEARTAEQKETAFRIRYQVYCVENPFENPDASQDALEKDRFDDQSIHSLLIHRPSGFAAGTVRMVLPRADEPSRSFAIQEVCDSPTLRDDERFPIAQTGEISRFCVMKDFRRRAADLPLTHFPANSEFCENEWRRVIPNMTLGLIEWLVRVSAREGLTHWCAVMEPKLLRLLTRLGIYFEPIGGLVEYHGVRQPCMAVLKPLLERVGRERPDVWDIITAGGSHCETVPAG